MTEQQAYQAMFAFLEQYYERTQSDEIGSLLGSMSKLTDGEPADLALLGDWQRAVERVRSGQVDTSLKLQ